MNAVDRYTRTAILLHWAIAAMIFVNIALGLGANYAPDAWVRPMIDLHKSIGIAVLGQVLLRLIWRLTHKPPAFPAGYRPWERRAAHLAHLALYGLILALPITGWIHDSAWSAAASHPLVLFWVVPWFRLGFITHLAPATKHDLRLWFAAIHTYFGYALYALLTLHIIGALKHQFVDRVPELDSGCYFIL
jgi:cytochrome b561